jgi:hypothetical protein
VSKISPLSFGEVNGGLSAISPAVCFLFNCVARALFVRQPTLKAHIVHCQFASLEKSTLEKGPSLSLCLAARGMFLTCASSAEWRLANGASASQPPGDAFFRAHLQAKQHTFHHSHFNRPPQKIKNAANFSDSSSSCSPCRQFVLCHSIDWR